MKDEWKTIMKVGVGVFLIIAICWRYYSDSESEKKAGEFKSLFNDCSRLLTTVEPKNAKESMVKLEELVSQLEHVAPNVTPSDMKHLRFGSISIESMNGWIDRLNSLDYSTNYRLSVEAYPEIENLRKRFFKAISTNGIITEKISFDLFNSSL